MAISQPHVQPDGAETIAGAWNFTNTGTALPTRTRSVWLPANVFDQVNGTVMTLTGVGTYPDRYSEWPMVTAPAAAPQAVGTGFQIPYDYSSGGTWKVVYSQSATSAVLWRAEVNVLGRVDGESAEGASEVVAASITPDGVAVNTQIDQIGAGGTFTAGDWVRVCLERDTAHADDTNPDTIRIMGLLFEYTGKY